MHIGLNSRFAKAAALFAGIHVLGGHWLAIQTVAWMGMFAANSQQTDFVGALEKTFGGEHPCHLCCMVESGKEKEKQQQQRQLVDTVNKVNAVPLKAFELPPRGETSMVYFDVAMDLDSWAISSPSPPPWSI